MEEMSIEKQVQQFKTELAQKGNDLVLAAEIGKKLLEQNQDLEDRLEELAQDHIKRVEQLEQDKYSLQMRLSSQDQVVRSQAAEMESLRESLQAERETTRTGERQEMTHAKEIQKMTGKVEELETCLERAAMTEEQLKKKIEHQDELLRDAHSKLSSLELAPCNNDEQLYNLQHELAKVKSDKDMISMELKDVSDHCQQLTFTVEVQNQRQQSLQNELEGREQQITSYFNLLEKTQEEVADLQIQLDSARMEATDVNKKGNSLFGEVEDRRKEAESKWISLKVQYESTKEQLNMKKQQVHKMRFQIAALLQMGGGRAESSQRERLEQSLEQSRSEVRMLTEKIKMLEKAKASEGMGPQYEEYKRLLSQSDKPDLLEFLQYKLKMAKAETEEVKKELHTQQLLQIAASDKLMDCERRLYSAEMEADRIRAANMKLLVTLDELKLKLNAKDNGSTKSKVNTGYREKICLKNPNGKKAAESNSESPTAEEQSSAPVDEDKGDRLPSEKSSDDGMAVPTSSSQKPCDQDSVNAEQHSKYILKPTNPNQPPVIGRSVTAKGHSKKTVSMCETVSVMDGSGTAKVKQLKPEEEEEEEGDRKENLGQENCDPEERQAMDNGSRGARHGGKKYHKVVHMKSNNTEECKMQ